MVKKTAIKKYNKKTVGKTVGKRNLTDDEITDILDFIEPSKQLPFDVAESVYNSVLRGFEQQLRQIETYTELIPEIKEEIKRQHFSSLVDPGECVGVICAQSCGEKQTQMTLNSVDWKEKILYTKDGNVEVDCIGKIIDNLLEENQEQIINIRRNRTEYLQLQDGWKIPSCDENGKTGWYKIEAITRHLPVGDLVKITTESGRSMTATQAKSFLVWNGEKFIDKNGSDVKIGDQLPTTYILEPPGNQYQIDGIELNEKNGYLLGVYLTTDMSMSTEDELGEFIIKHCGEGSDKKLPAFAHKTNEKFLQGFICAAKLGNAQTEDICYGIEFLKMYSFFPYKFCANKDVILDPIVKIEYVKGTTEFVYDLTVETTRNFQLFNGLNCRDTFHKAGASEKGMTSGVPRFKEINNATKFPRNRNCKIFFKSHFENIQEIREAIKYSIVGFKIKDVVLDMEVVVGKQDEPWYELHNMIYEKEDCEYGDKCIKTHFDLYKLYQYKLTLKQIADSIENEYSDLYCIPSPLEKGRIDIFVDTQNITLPDEGLSYINDSNLEQIYMEETVIPNLEEIYVCGIPGITNLYFAKEEDEWILETDCIAGKNKLNSEEKKFFKKLLSHSLVDPTKTMCNDMWEIYETLGIEATREFLFNEINTIMEGINECHIDLLVNRLTYTGTITGISRYTLKKEESGPMGKASFEETMDNFLTAGAHGDIENTDGVSASIVCGKRAKIGTGMMDLIMDIGHLPDIIEEDEESVMVENEVVEIGYDSD